MIIVSTDTVAGREIRESLGLVRGSTIQAKHIGKDFMAGLKTLVGGEIREYTEMLESARQIALGRMVKSAEALDADAIVNVRFATSSIMQGAAELLAYGTAVKLD
ncbi:MAG: hypothetical protein AVO33_00730 [delta proteobacterium ML8_F1]|nr:MAG: hypothetical protein AVO33_00730 [delta proteobacterium ML8_F1]